MQDLFKHLNRVVMEPKVYALRIVSAHAQVLHLGVHFSLEEAYAVARVRLQQVAPHKPGEPIDIDCWNSMPARDCITQLLDPNKIIPGYGPAALATAGPASAPTAAPRVTEEGSIPLQILEAIMAFEGVPSPKSTKSSPTAYVTNEAMADEPMTVEEHVNDVKEARNELLHKLIETGDNSAVEKLGRIISAQERKLVLKKIAEKAPKPQDPKS